MKEIRLASSTVATNCENLSCYSIVGPLSEFIFSFHCNKYPTFSFCVIAALITTIFVVENKTQENERKNK